MSKFEVRPNTTVRDIAKRKGGEPVVCLTAYTALVAQLLDKHVDLLLVGDSVGMVIHGMPNTLGVTMEMMIMHGQAVMRGAPRACVIVDMPFGSYEESKEQAYRNAVRIMRETGCAGVKLEGGAHMAPTIQFLVQRGIPVMGHVGLLPQSVNMSGYAAKGRKREEWDAIIADAKAVAEAGAFATVLEAVAADLAAKITEEVPNVTIGIGASAACDGQILVTEDMIGLFATTPSFVKRYAEWGGAIDEAAANYAEEVKARRFPGREHTYSMKE
ncbi:MAG: 3-methyl-2-oxobutanoate hydroxymethyltransferase [Alphaproteobacteria bacterium]|nr:3-methyl-2-oxobutanoate hydroxymethyltransferase [Alphaproteobacteria bacterium]